MFGNRRKGQAHTSLLEVGIFNLMERFSPVWKTNWASSNSCFSEATELIEDSSCKSMLKVAHSQAARARA